VVYEQNVEYRAGYYLQDPERLTKREVKVRLVDKKSGRIRGGEKEILPAPQNHGSP